MRSAMAFAFVVGCIWHVDTVAAREWISRSGEAIVEGELVNAEADVAVIKEASSGKLVRIPFAKLSLSDVQYVREAMKSAGIDAAAATNSVPPSATSKAKAVKSGKSGSDRRRGPQMAAEGRSGWQASPDPTSVPWSVPANSKLRIPVPDGFGPDIVTFPYANGPIVMIGGNQPGSSREAWDLRTATRSGVIREELKTVTKYALSPDGLWLATSSVESPGKVELWSFETGKKVGAITLSQQFESVAGIDFAGTTRLVLGLPLQNALVVYNLSSRAAMAKVPMQSVSLQDGYAISAGGHYAAIAKQDRLELFDLRNGAFAGDLQIPKPSSGGLLFVRAIDFSADGEEIAVLIERLEEKQLVCWSMKTGKQIAHHRLSGTLQLQPGFFNTRSRTIDWLPDNRGWLLHGAAVVDREQGGPVWVAERDASSPGPTIRRVVDKSRLAVVSGAYGSRTLQLTDIPWASITEGQRVVSQGGAAKDVGLPDVTRPDWSTSRRLALASAAQKYEPVVSNVAFKLDNPIQLDPRDGLLKQAWITKGQPARCVVSRDPTDYQNRRPGMESARAGHFSDVLDGVTGEKLFHFDVPFATDLMDVSPSGERGIFVEVSERERIDVYDYRTGKHVIGWRPGNDTQSQLNRRIDWAGFVNEQQVLTLSHIGDLVLWNIDNCRAHYVLPLGVSAKVFMNGSRSHALVAPSGDQPSLVEIATGKYCGRLQIPDSRPGTISDAAFRADSRCIALLLFLGDHRRILVWDAQRDRFVADMTVPIKSFGLSWSGKAHVVMHSTGDLNNRSQKYWQFTVVDVAAQRVGWNYQLPIGAKAVDGPDDRFWCFVTSGGRSSPQLIAVDLPDKEAAGIIAQTPPPRPLFGPGTRVALKVTTGGMPDDLEDRRPREEKFERELRDHFQNQLTEAGIRVVNAAPVVFEVAVKNLTQKDIVAIRELPRQTELSVIVRADKTIRATLTIRNDDLVLWEKQNYVNTGDVKVGRAPKNVSPGSLVLLAQWDAAQRWCQSMRLPKSLYHPDSYLGVGESELTALGTRLLRKYPQ